jgi:hypothetical protein
MPTYYRDPKANVGFRQTIADEEFFTRQHLLGLIEAFEYFMNRLFVSLLSSSEPSPIDAV